MKGLQFDPERHLFSFKGQEVPSVTQVLGDLGFLKNRNFYTAESATRGTYIHQIIALHEQGTLDLMSIDPRLQGYHAAWLDWRACHSQKILAIEKHLYDPIYRYAGIVDLLAPWGKGRRAAIEIKSGSPEPWHDLQVVAYMLAAKATDAIVVYLRQTGSHETVWVSDAQQQAEDWRACMRVYYRRRK